MTNKKPKEKLGKRLIQGYELIKIRTCNPFQENVYSKKNV